MKVKGLPQGALKHKDILCFIVKSIHYRAASGPNRPTRRLNMLFSHRFLIVFSYQNFVWKDFVYDFCL